MSRIHRTTADTIALCILVACGALYWFYMSIHSSFWEPDEATFAYRMASGNPLILPFRSIGRFFPLGYQEFNLLGRFTSSADVFHAVALGQVMLSAVFVWFVFFRLAWRFRIWLILAIYSTPSIFYISQSFIYTERNIILLLAVFVLGFCLFHRYQKPAYLLAALTAAFLSMFYKETVFLIFLGFSLTRAGYLYAHARETSGSKGRPRLSDFSNELALIGSVCFFLGAYYIFTHQVRSGPLYDHVLDRGVIAATIRNFSDYAIGHMLFALLVVGYPIRLLFLSKLRFHPTWDSLLVGALFFFGGNIVLGRLGPYSYYSAPGDFLILVGVFGLLIDAKMNTRVVAALAGVLFLVQLPTSVDYARSYKRLSRFHDGAVSFLQEQAQAQDVWLTIDGHDKGWPYWGLASALRLRGMQVKEGQGHLLICDTDEANVTPMKGRPVDVPERVQESSPRDDYVYVPFFSFWQSPEQHQSAVQEFLDDEQHYVQVFPNEGTRAVTATSIYIFRRKL